MDPAQSFARTVRFAMKSFMAPLRRVRHQKAVQFRIPSTSSGQAPSLPFPPPAGRHMYQTNAQQMFVACVTTVKDHKIWKNVVVGTGDFYHLAPCIKYTFFLYNTRAVGD
jgi:hypothetical protein